MGHGDDMVPLTSYTSVGGRAGDEAALLGSAWRPSWSGRARAGQEIVDLLKTGSAFQAPSAAVAQMVDSILLDKKQILPCAAYLDGEYGIDDLFCGVPVKLGAGGVEEIVSDRPLGRGAQRPAAHRGLRAGAGAEDGPLAPIPVS